MLLEVLKQDKYLTILIVVVGLIWFFVFLRNVWVLNKSTTDFQQQYHQIINADEYKVKGKFEN
ncbi:hypothetical protein HZC31_07435 [Candidatus Woesearchaeota archaeon]|nr:hypothetical protein [Candidatus Woesearchaeota archaeon]